MSNTFDIDGQIALAEKEDKARFFYLVESDEGEAEHHHSLASLLRLIKEQGKRKPRKMKKKRFFLGVINSQVRA